MSFRALILSTWAGTRESQGPPVGTQAGRSTTVTLTQGHSPPHLPHPTRPVGLCLQKLLSALPFFQSLHIAHVLLLACPAPGIPLHTSAKGKLRQLWLTDT